MASDANPAMEVEDLTVAYSDQPVLWDIDLTLPDGQLIASNDDYGTIQASRIATTLAQSGQHRIVVTTFSEGNTGPYTLTLREGEQEDLQNQSPGPEFYQQMSYMNMDPKFSPQDEEIYQRMIDSEKFILLGKMASGFAHEINNPIMIIQNYISLLISETTENGNIEISIYLPLNKVANSLESKYAFEPVIYTSTFSLTKSPSTNFSKFGIF